MPLLKILLKIIAIPFVLMLTILVAVMIFFFQLSDWISVLVSSILGLGGAALLFTGDTYCGIGVLVMAFLISPYGLPTIAEWIAELLCSLNASLKCFIVS
ncbi:hypothetical protein DS742_17425 [Lacrimispora amygdalina]|uniref:Succinate dehydrogenase n=1 Tax=Lacrimispora amygdalina TaxID=253257 RepID=A0A3E2N9D4_9FIRM|nr:CD1845 family protein [Clostridium indicum]RFZ77596.1 hypothetical protein DS742_17425 [Clostridium indicum]